MLYLGNYNLIEGVGNLIPEGVGNLTPDELTQKLYSQLDSNEKIAKGLVEHTPYNDVCTPLDEINKKNKKANFNISNAQASKITQKAFQSLATACTKNASNTS
jgi:hypothetical protein